MRSRRASFRGAGVQGLVDAFQTGAEALKSRLAQLRAEVEVIERALATVSGNGSPARRGPGRPRKAQVASITPTRSSSASKGSGKGRRAKGQDLASMMERAMTGKKPMGVADIASAVQKSGYKSSSPAFKKIVAMRLLDKKRFRRVGRGMYASVK